MSGCTVVTGSAGERCGAPAVASFTGRDGERFFECEAHVVVVPERAPEIAVGSYVEVEHVGRTKVGFVREVKRSTALVEVGLAGGLGVKVIRRPLAELKAVAR